MMSLGKDNSSLFLPLIMASLKEFNLFLEGILSCNKTVFISLNLVV